ncbi:MAG: nuclear transport factor 2 family protein [Candidatus Methylomirabilis sp.]|nr:nuclear transport factor 2 family protein [Deltaproteobacteria bacterium]
MGAAETRKVVTEYFDAINRGDFPALLGALAEDVTFWVPPSLPDGALYRGKPAVTKLFEDSFALYGKDGGMRVNVESLLCEGDEAACAFVISAVSAKGEPYENHYHFHFRLRGGKIAAIREHFDSLYAHRKLWT